LVCEAIRAGVEYIGATLDDVRRWLMSSASMPTTLSPKSGTSISTIFFRPTQADVDRTRAVNAEHAATGKRPSQKSPSQNRIRPLSDSLAGDTSGEWCSRMEGD
jgi:hypothetical protein